MPKSLVRVALLAALSASVSVLLPPALPGALAATPPATVKTYLSEGEVYLRHKQRGRWLVILSRSGGEYYATFVDTRLKKSQKVEIGATEVIRINMATAREVSFDLKDKESKHPGQAARVYFVWSNKAKVWQPRAAGR